MKQKIRINERQFRQIVTESVKRVLKENQYSDFDNSLYHLYEMASNYLMGSEEYTADEIIEEISGVLGEHFG